MDVALLAEGVDKLRKGAKKRSQIKKPPPCANTGAAKEQLTLKE